MNMPPEKTSFPFYSKNLGYKVPFRMVYCNTLRVWLAETIYCHIYLRLCPPNLPNFPEVS